jgi:hypothetical protein
MGESLRVRNGSKSVLAKFGNLTLSKLITRAQLAKKEGKLINMMNSS